MGAEGSEAGVFGNYPVAYLEILWGEGVDGLDFETAFVAGDSRGLWGAVEGCKGWTGGIDALDLVYVCWVYGGGEGAEDDM